VDARSWWDRDLQRAAEGVSPTVLRWTMVLFGIVLVANVVRLGLADTGAQVLLAVVGVALSVVVLILSFAIHRRQVARPA
jgi:uncharacterized oligopeptide transporter (OPT) family protein